MNKKATILAITSLILLALILVFGKSVYTFKKSSPAYFSNQMSGRVSEVKSGSIVVRGAVKSSDPKTAHEEDKTIEFAITPQTVFKNNALAASAGQIKSGKSFHPQTKIQPGRLQDIAVNTIIFSIQSQENLFAADKATAVEINYLTYDFPRPQ